MTVTPDPIGISNPDKPGQWLVPPLPAEAGLCDVVGHFLRFNLWSDTDTTHLLVYYEGYHAAVEAAPTHELRYAADWRWYQELRNCLAHCIIIFQEQRTVETQKVSHNVRQLQPVARTVGT